MKFLTIIFVAITIISCFLGAMGDTCTQISGTYQFKDECKTKLYGDEGCKSACNTDCSGKNGYCGNGDSKTPDEDTCYCVN
uniref:Putative secreted salivary protein n=1 Tax=Xenopsylla cheopis TaxID=163159 RepID=A2IAD1_XENCH|nr:putative secreted salivary protein [Xenopsylla cheopis]